MNNKQIQVANDDFIPHIQEMISEGRKVRFRVRGWSMRIFVEHERDEVLLAPVGLQGMRVGDVVLAMTHLNRYVLHRIIAISGDKITLQGDGNIGIVEYCTPRQVVGIAEGFYRKGRQQPDLCSGLKWRVYSAIWLEFTPFRRYILAAYRRIWLRFFPPI